MVQQRTKRYTLQGIGRSVEALVGIVGTVGTLSNEVGTLRSEVSTLSSEFGTLSNEVGTLRSEVSTLTYSVSSLTEMVGAMAVEQTVMKEDIANLKQNVTHLDLKTDGIINDARAFRAEMVEFKEDTERNFQAIREDLNTVLPDHELRIAVLEGKPVAVLGV